MENCNICHTESIINFKAKSTKSNYSGKTVYDIFTDINGTELDYLTNICYNCMEQLNEFDKFTTKAQEIKENFITKIQKFRDEKPAQSDNSDVEFINNIDFDAESSEEINAKPKILKKSTETRIRPMKLPPGEKPWDIVANREKLEKLLAKRRKKAKVNDNDDLFDFQNNLIPCPEPDCSKVFDTQRRLKAHLPYHVKERNFICQICFKDFKTKGCIDRHTTKVHSTTRWICDGCGKVFTYKDSIIKHYQSVHLGLKNSVCQICGRGFSQGNGLKKHILYAHTDPEMKSFQCIACPAKFFIKSKLDQHMKGHANEREFKCPICGREFNHKYNVRSHLKKAHKIGAEKLKPSQPIVCQLCGKLFSMKKRLEEHLKSVHDTVPLTVNVEAIK